MTKYNIPKYTTKLGGKWPHRYKYIYFSDPDNQELLHFLHSYNFFDFHCTNNAQITTEHAVIAFFYSGGLHAYRRGFTCQHHFHEIHHLDGNTLNSRPSNLCYLPVEMHNQISKHQRSIHRYLKIFHKRHVKSPNDVVIWNRQGRLIKNPVNFIAKLILLSVLLTYQEYAYSNSFKKPLVNLNELSNWFIKITRRLQLGIDSSFVPTSFFSFF